jgi:DNA integrity scanning protein DisA with diadenylate cyclase activity
MLKKINETLFDLLIGIIMYGLLLLLLSFILPSGNKMTYLLGSILGIVVSIFLSFHLYRSIDKSLYMNEKRAINYSRSMTIFRLLIMFVALILTLYLPTIFNTISVLLGIMSLKISAYLQPVTHRYVSFLILKKGR